MGYDLGNPYSLLLLFTAAFSLALAGFLGRYRSERGAGPLVGLLVGAAIWAFSDAMRIGAPTGEAILLWNKVGYAGVVLIAPSALLFAAAYTGRDGWFRWTRVGVLVAISALTYLVVVTNPMHGLWRVSESTAPGTAPPVLDEQFGPVHVLWNAYVLLFVVPVSLWMFATARRNQPAAGSYRRRTTVVAFAFLVPALASALYVTGLVPVDPTPLGFLVTGIAFSVAVLRYRLMDLVPIARATVLDSMDSGVVVIDREGTVVDANSRAMEILGRDENEVIGTTMRTLLADLPVETERFLDVRETEETITVEEGDDTTYYDVSMSPIASDGEYLGRVAIFSDVTDRVRRQRELRERTAALERQNERLDEFASLVSHDLRNPLNVALGSVELARKNDETETLDRAESALERIDDLIEDMLVLSRAGAGLEETATVDVAAAARRAWQEHDLDGGELRVREDTPSVEADRTQLGHLLENLVRNAVEHNDPPVTVTVGGLADDAGFYVEDDGSGIPADERDAVLEHGYTTGENGTGFGLSIVSHVADAHGWDLRITDADDGGARFEITGPDVPRDQF